MVMLLYQKESHNQYGTNYQEQLWNSMARCIKPGHLHLPPKSVIPAKAGIHDHGVSKVEPSASGHFLEPQCSWIPACAGMTVD
jgi:hypothetical protein